MRTQEATAATESVNGAPPQDDVRVEEITALSSQVSSAFSELSRVQSELANRMERFSEREADLDQQRAALQKDRDEHEARVVRAERLASQAEAREAAVARREEAVGRREDAASAFQELLGRMAAALDDPTPTKLSEAAEAATLSLRESHAVLSAKATGFENGDLEAGDGTDGELSDDAPIAARRADGLRDDEGVDLADFSEEELRKLGMLEKLGTASTADIAQQIRAERDGSGDKKKGWFS